MKKYEENVSIVDGALGGSIDPSEYSSYTV